MSIAFAGSVTENICVDCGKPATRMINYVNYEVGDLLCLVDAKHRSRVLRVPNVKSIPADIRRVKG